ncbi:Bug family tripartite tricarboxylate transporter substrate binding protein [Falsiroseomonas oryzae]|uniref:Bug family tripartite tricarboxylate transporter substrate binding protein n=1 Tax=Falsiroseomonas oryzae TaxID=2766473 RepID=UPI0022EABC5E|nr:tripartite tricarboxylate transporter substrate binding protein [Roseomonas sp. MO-31]
MIRLTRRSALLLPAAALPAATPGTAVAQAWPQRTVTLVSPWPPGGSNDTFSRLIAQRLAAAFGQPVIVENRPGATGTIGAAQVARAPADGYTLVMGSSPTHATAAAIIPGLTYDPVRDFAPVTMVATVQNVLVVNPALPVASVQELIALARREPGRLSFASAGNGSSQHLSGEMFKVMTGVDMLHVPYRGAAPAVADIVAGHIQLGFHNMPDVVTLVRSGQLRALAVTGERRAPVLPDVPTVAEAGVPGYAAAVWFGVFAPAGTPRPIIDRLHAEISRALADPEIKGRLDALGNEVSGMGPDAFAAYVRAEVGRWGDIVRRAGVQPG